MAHKRFLRLWAAALALPALLLAACSQDDGLGTDGGERVAVSFTASMDGAALPSAKTTGTRSIAHEFTGVTAAGVPYRDYTDADGFQTRAFYTGAVSGTGTGVPKTRTTTGGDEWVQDDAAGIFMLTTGGDLTTPANVLANNVEYTATPGSSASSASFAPADAAETIYYPQSGNVDFVAYYPYGGTGTGSGEITADYTYKVSVADQSDPAAIDLLWAKATNVSKSGTAVALAFDHKMSSVMLNVKAGDGIDAADAQSLLAGAVVFNGMPVTAELALQDGTLTAGAAGVFSPLKAATAQGGADATFSAILVPQPDGGTGRTVTFTVGGKEYVWNIPDGDIFAAGNHYTYPVTIRKNGITVGEPTITDWGENDHATVSAEPRDPAPENTVLIPAGTFKMGSPVRGDSNADDNEKPQHWVRLTQDFYMSKYEVTNAQYAAFLNAKNIDGSSGTGEGEVSYYWNGTPQSRTYVFVSDCTTGGNSPWGVRWNAGTWEPVPGYEEYPVIYVTWYGAKAFADWVGGSLPTEAQWEYACRAGTETYFSFGDIINGDRAYMWYSPYDSATHQVGKKKPNPWGLFDMHGNVFEWCLDQLVYDGDYRNYQSADTENAAISDPIGTTGDRSILRGGSWYSRVAYCRSAYRQYAYLNSRSHDYGFRVVFNK